MNAIADNQHRQMDEACNQHRSFNDNLEESQKQSRDQAVQKDEAKQHRKSAKPGVLKASYDTPPPDRAGKHNGENVGVVVEDSDPGADGYDWGNKTAHQRYSPKKGLRKRAEAVFSNLNVAAKAIDYKDNEGDDVGPKNDAGDAVAVRDPEVTDVCHVFLLHEYNIE